MWTNLLDVLFVGQNLNDKIKWLIVSRTLSILFYIPLHNAKPPISNIYTFSRGVNIMLTSSHKHSSFFSLLCLWIPVNLKNLFRTLMDGDDFKSFFNYKYSLTSYFHLLIRKSKALELILFRLLVSIWMKIN